MTNQTSDTQELAQQLLEQANAAVELIGPGGLLNQLTKTVLEPAVLKRWIAGALRHRISHVHMPYYPDEFAFRFNRRKPNAVRPAVLPAPPAGGSDHGQRSVAPGATSTGPPVRAG